MCRAIIISVLLSISTFAQSEFSLQFNSGLLSPFNSDDEFSGNLQLNYEPSPNFVTYIGLAYYGYDEYYLGIIEENHVNEIVAASDHRIFNIMAGIEYILHRGEFINLFAGAEVGYAGLKYQSVLFSDVEGEDVTSSPGAEEFENLFSTGLNVGLSHDFTDQLTGIIGFKFISVFNSSFSGFFYQRSLFKIYYGGIKINI